MLCQVLSRSLHAVVCRGEIWGELDEFVLIGEICLGEALVEEKFRRLLGWENCESEIFKARKTFCGHPV